MHQFEIIRVHMGAAGHASEAGHIVSPFSAFMGGFLSFFSVWQSCILQISPFFMAYIVGIYLSETPAGRYANMREGVILPSLYYMLGFSVIFSLLNSSGLVAGHFLIYNLGTLKTISGLYLIIVSLFIILLGRALQIEKSVRHPLLYLISLLLGMTFAIVYSPCITPTLSRILELANMPQKAVTLSILAFMYGIGLSTAFGITGLFLAILIDTIGFAKKRRGMIKDICGIILCVLAILAISGYTRAYKSFLLSFFMR